MSLEKTCPGHEYPIQNDCYNCSPDYDTNHFPCNLDCQIRRDFLNSYSEVEKILIEKGERLDNCVKEMIITGLFLRNLMKSKRKISNEETINAILDEIIQKRRRRLSIRDEFLDIVDLRPSC